MKEKFEEFQGYLKSLHANIPPIQSVEDLNIRDEEVWEAYHSLIDNIGEIVGKNYGKYKVKPEKGPEGELQVGNLAYRTKVEQLMRRLDKDFWMLSNATTVRAQKLREEATQAGISEFALSLGVLAVMADGQGKPEGDFRHFISSEPWADMFGGQILRDAESELKQAGLWPWEK